MASMFHLMFLVLVMLLSQFLAVAQTIGNVPVGASITAADDSPSWRSSSGEFAFGFRRLENKDYFLLSIWYDKIPEKTIVWYVNGNESNDLAVPRGSKVELTANRGLVLADPQGNPIWISYIRQGTAVSLGVMNDTGNFVLQNRNSDRLWESFNHPSDTLLPTQIMEIGVVVSSRRTETKFSLGRFQLRLLENGNLVLNAINLQTRFRYDAYYTTGTSFDGSNSSNSGYRLIFNESGYMYILGGNGLREDLTQKTLSTTGYYHRATINFDGVFAQYIYPKTSTRNRSWSPVWSKPDNICTGLYVNRGGGVCGYNNICSLNLDQRPTCSCPKAFSLVDKNDNYGSCVEDFELSCKLDDGQNSTHDGHYDFLELKNVDFPNGDGDADHLQTLDEEQCRKSCFNDCLCGAVAFSGSSCWKKRFPLSNGRAYSDYNDYKVKTLIKFRIGNRNSRNSSKLRTSRMVIIVQLTLGFSVFFILFFCGFIYHKRKMNGKKKGNNVRKHDYLQQEMGIEFWYSGIPMEESGNNDLPVIPLRVIRKSTYDFSDEYKIGEGGFGPVYKGELADGKEVAIKRLSKVSTQGLEEFKNEVILIVKLQHRNLVRLLGCCVEENEKLLVYEYMPNGSLALHLFDTEMSEELDWKLRISIINGIVKGLVYLHEDSRLRIIHRDLKASNILLDHQMNPKISDFGMARIFGGDQQQANTNRVVGTYGYMAPEYAMQGIFSVKSDVFSFGVLLLEIIAGKRNGGFYISEHGQTLLTYTWNLWQEGKEMEIMDSILEKTCVVSEVLKCIHIALLCVQEDAIDRPTMSNVAFMLASDTMILPKPKQPAFSVGRMDQTHVSAGPNCSVNDVTISNLLPR